MAARSPSLRPPGAPSSVPPSPAPRTYRITELALEFDITARAIRFYEDMGLLAPQRVGRQRVYTQRDRTRLKLTLRGKRLGLSLQEIKQLVEMYDVAAGAAPQLQAFVQVLDAHRRQLEQQREDIVITLAEIEQHAQRCRALLVQAPAAPRVEPERAKAQRTATPALQTQRAPSAGAKVSRRARGA